MISEAEETPLINDDSHDTPARSHYTLAIGGLRDVIAAGIACLTAISIGFTVGYSGSAELDKELLVLLDDEAKKAWFGSLSMIGAVVGSPLAALCVERLGRKATLLASNLPVAVGWILILVPNDLTSLYLGRFLTGVANGMLSLTGPLYIGEIATKERRGLLESAFLTSFSVGLLITYCLSLVLNWAWLAVAGILAAAVSSVLVLAIPETPRWLIAHDHNQEAIASLRWLNTSPGGGNFEAEYLNLQRHASKHASRRGSTAGLSVREISHRGVYKPFLISLGLMVFQKLSGIDAILFYSVEILQSAGFNRNPILPSIVVSGILMPFTVVASFLMDRVGRRILLMTSGIFVTISCFGLGTAYYIQGHQDGESYSWLSLVSMCLFVAAFQIGWGPVPWIAMSELFTMRWRGVASGVATSVNFLVAFVVTKEFLPVVTATSQYGAFFGFGVMNFVGTVFVWFLLPETKGRSLEEIEELFTS